MLTGQTIVASNCLQENLMKSICCPFCQTDVILLENLSTRSKLGSSWIVSCQNKYCLSRNMNAAFKMKPRANGFENNQASVLDFRAIGQGHTAAAKMLSFLGLKPINKNYWSKNSQKLKWKQKCWRLNLTFEVKERKFTLIRPHTRAVERGCCSLWHHNQFNLSVHFV